MFAVELKMRDEQRESCVKMSIFRSIEQKMDYGYTFFFCCFEFPKTVFFYFISIYMYSIWSNCSKYKIFKYMHVSWGAYLM